MHHLNFTPFYCSLIFFFSLLFKSWAILSQLVHMYQCCFNYVEMHRSCFYISNVQFWVLHGQKSDLQGQRLSLWWYIVQMGHLSILMWVKVHHNQNTFTVFEFLNFTLFDQKCFKTIFDNETILKGPAGIDSNLWLTDS